MIDLTKIIEGNLKGDRRNTGMLHCSSLSSPLRHTQLRMTGLFEERFDLIGSIRMFTGTLWHDKLESWMSGYPHMSEVDLTPYLPEGWTGRCDYLIWDEDIGKFVVVDIKTQKGEGMKWLNGKPKEDHVWQVSAYVLGAANAGIPVALDRAYVYYLPMNDVVGEDIVPAMIEFKPFLLSEVGDRMEGIKDEVDWFLVDIDTDGDRGGIVTVYREDYVRKPGGYDKLNQWLAPWPAPEQRIYKNKAQGCYDVKMVPHWSHNYCPYPEVCGCSEQVTYKIGHYTWHQKDPFDPKLIYVPRKGYEDVPLTVTPPTESMMNSL